MRMQQLPLTATTISPLPRIPTAQHGCNGCVGKESDRIMTTSEKHPKIHRIALVDNDPRALDSLSAVDQLAQIIMRMCNGEVMEGFETPALANLRISREAETAPSLTVREEQIISLCAEGMLDREIAERLGISEATIRKHMQSILRKLNCKTSRQAVALWVRSNAL